MAKTNNRGQGLPTHSHLTARELTADELLAANELLLRAPNTLRPVLPTTRPQGSPFIAWGLFEKGGAARGVAYIKDFGARAVFSGAIITPDIEAGDCEFRLAKNTVENFALVKQTRVLGFATSECELSLLTKLGFIQQEGEYFMKRFHLQNHSKERSAASRELLGSFFLDINGPHLVADSLRLWGESADMHLSPWETHANLLVLTRSAGALLGARLRQSNELIAAILISENSGDAMLYHLLVRPDVRRLGIGSLLVESALATLSKRGCESALVCVHDQRAIEFWHAAGFSLASSSRLLQLDV